MLAAEYRHRDERQSERRAKPARRTLAFYGPRPPLLGSSTKESTSSKATPKPKPSAGDFVATRRGSVADAFFGASPVVASALGIRSGATPRGRIHYNPHPSALPRKEDISTLLGIGHFYFALTMLARMRLRGGGLPGGGGVIEAVGCRENVQFIPPGTGRNAHARGSVCPAAEPRASGPRQRNFRRRKPTTFTAWQSTGRLRRQCPAPTR